MMVSLSERCSRTARFLAVRTILFMSENELPCRWVASCWAIWGDTSASVRSPSINWMGGFSKRTVASNRRHAAGSSMSGWFVAAIKMEVDGHSSMACSRTLTSRLSSPTSFSSSRLLAIASNSSKNRMQGRLLACSITALIFVPVLPSKLDITDARSRVKIGSWSLLAIQCAASVLPTPGGPVKIMERIGSSPAVKSSLWLFRS
ncbi:hypothetical protein SAMN05216287_2507 [Pseudomonas kuykendallii]|uniref:Uncharacterized protein n=1 Tax=Pseudomonas kuykendallii TaxID=1007099 RepID=A0A1H2ZZU4_9PSED|nr:hypothetical protein SAMN05216287_2507 [Pseudomonas kuykendallii]